MLPKLTDGLSALRTLCITLRQNPVGAGCVVALASIGLAALVVMSRY